MAQVNWQRVDAGQSIQAAINDLANLPTLNGGMVYLPPGNHEITATLELPYPPGTPPTDWYYNPTKPISILGDGANATVIKRASSFNGPLLRCRRPFSSISGITFDGAGAGATDTSAVIEVGGATGEVRGINLRDLIVKSGPFQCVKVLGGPSPATVSALNSFERCVFTNNGAGSLVEIQSRNTAQEFRSCQFVGFQGNGVLLTQAESVSFYDCLFASPVSGSQAFLLSDQAGLSQLVNCVFDDGSYAGTTLRWFVDLSANSNGWSILGCHFIRRVPNSNLLAQAVRIGSTSLGPCFGTLIVDPVIRMPLVVTPGPPGLLIDIQHPSTECVVVGGYAEVGEPPASTRYPLEITDGSGKTAWISHRRWRIPQTTTQESLTADPTLFRLGDFVSRSGRGLEAWTQVTSPGPSGSPLTVNRYATVAALLQLSTNSLNLGTLAWVDNDGTGVGALMACVAVSPPASTWKKVRFV